MLPSNHTTLPRQREQATPCDTRWSSIRPISAVYNAHGQVRGTLSAGRPRLGENVDEVAVLRAADGERMPLNSVERRAAVMWLTARRVSAAEIALRLGMSQRTVRRWRRALRLTHVPSTA